MSSMDIDPPDGQDVSVAPGKGFLGHRNRGRGNFRGGFRGRGRGGNSRSAVLPHAPQDGEWKHDMYRLMDSGTENNSSTSGNKAKTTKLGANSLAARIGKSGTAPSAPAVRPSAAKEMLTKQLVNNPLFAALQGDRSLLKKGKVAIKGSAVGPPKKEAKFEIKGSGGKAYVRISHLATGTTEEDVVAFLSKLGVGVERCATVIRQDGVLAEALFGERSHADACVEQIDNAMADGRIIRAEIVSASQLKTSLAVEAKAAAANASKPEPIVSKMAPVMIQDGTHHVGATLYSDAIIKRGRGFQ